jgi:hypothetical protein
MAESSACLSARQKGAAGRRARFGGDPPEILSGENPELTIFFKLFLLLACDELHQLRNSNATQAGVMKISSNSVVRIGATATPIFTGAKVGTATVDCVFQGCC